MGQWPVLRMAVMGLIICGVATIVSVTFLLWSGSQAPEGLIAIAGTSVGALATLMVSHPGKQRDDSDSPPHS